MPYPTRIQVNNLSANPDYFAEQLPIPKIDKVISAFVRERQYKLRCSK